MTEEGVRSLLAVAMAFDHRRPGAADIAAWSDAAERARWDFRDAQEAIKIHYATSTEYLMPGHVTAILRANRRQPPSAREALALPAGPPAGLHRVRELIDDVARRLGWQRQPPDNGADPLAVGCPVPACLARPGRPCVRVVARGRKRGQLVTMAPHPSRRDLALNMELP